MAQHEVKCSLPKAEVLHADLGFNVRRNGEAFGKLLDSKGAAVWLRGAKYWRGKKLAGRTLKGLWINMHVPNTESVFLASRAARNFGCALGAHDRRA